MLHPWSPPDVKPYTDVFGRTVDEYIKGTDFMFSDCHTTLDVDALQALLEILNH